MIRRGPGTPLAPPSDASVKLIRTLTITVFLQWFGSTSIIPMLPVYVRDMGGTVFMAGLVMAAFFAAGVLSQYPMGRLADRIGRKPVLLIGLGVYALATLTFLLPINPAIAIVLRSFQGLGAGASAVAALAMVSGAVAVERRGRAFAAIFGAEFAGMAVGPLIGAIVGVRNMWLMFLVSGVVVLVACIPAARIVEAPAELALRHARTDADGVVAPLAPLRWNRSMIGGIVAAGALGMASGVYDICWTLLLLSRGASGWQIGVSWTLFAVPFLLAARPSGWLADHMDRRALVLGGLGVATLFCASYPFIHGVPLLMVLSGIEALGFAAAMPALQSLLTQGSEPSEVGRIQGMFGTTQTALTALSTALAGAAFAVASWLPFVTASCLTALALIATALVWRTVAGHVHPAIDSFDVDGETSVAADDGSVALDSSRADDQPAVGVSTEVQ